MDIEHILNDALNKALCSKNRIQQPNSNNIAEFVNEYLAAINYTHSCEELKDKEVLSFEEWLFVNNYKKLFDYFVKDSISFTESELMQIYNDKVINL